MKQSTILLIGELAALEESVFAAAAAGEGLAQQLQAAKDLRDTDADQAV